MVKVGLGEVAAAEWGARPGPDASSPGETSQRRARCGLRHPRSFLQRANQTKVLPPRAALPPPAAVAGWLVRLCWMRLQKRQRRARRVAQTHVLSNFLRLFSLKVSLGVRLPLVIVGNPPPPPASPGRKGATTGNHLPTSAKDLYEEGGGRKSVKIVPLRRKNRTSRGFQQGTNKSVSSQD